MADNSASKEVGCHLATTAAPESKIGDLLEWCRKGGAMISPKIVIGHASRGTKVRGLVVAEGSQPIKKGEIIMSVPDTCPRISDELAMKDLGIGFERGLARFSERYSQKLFPTTALITYIALSKRHPEASKIGVYAENLPSEAPDLPMFWPEKFVDMLPASVSYSCYKNRIQTDALFDQCQRLVSSCSDSSETQLTRKEFEWAYSNMISRGGASNQTSIVMFHGWELLIVEIVPALDMMNFQPEGSDPADPAVASTKWIRTGDALNVIARRTLRAGHELTSNYEREMNVPSMFQTYGFVPELDPDVKEHLFGCLVDINGFVESQMSALCENDSALAVRKRALFEKMKVLGESQQLFMFPGGDPKPIKAIARAMTASNSNEMGIVEAAWRDTDDRSLATDCIPLLSKSSERRANLLVLALLKFCWTFEVEQHPTFVNFRKTKMEIDWAECKHVEQEPLDSSQEELREKKRSESARVLREVVASTFRSTAERFAKAAGSSVG